MDRGPLVIDQEIDGHVHNQLSGVVRQGDIGDQLGIGVVDRGADHRCQAEQVDVLRAVGQDREVIPHAVKDQVAAVYIHVEIAVTLVKVGAAAEYHPDVLIQSVVIAPAHGRYGDKLVDLGHDRFDRLCRGRHIAHPQDAHVARGLVDLEGVGAADDQMTILGPYVEIGQVGRAVKRGIDLFDEVRDTGLPQRGAGPDRKGDASPGIAVAVVEHEGDLFVSGRRGVRVRRGVGIDALPHVHDHVDRDPPLGHELALGRDAAQLALDPQVGLDLVEMGRGHDLDFLGAVKDDPAVLGPGLDLGRAVDQDACAGEVEDIALQALARIVAAGDLDQAARFQHRAYPDLVLGIEDDLGMGRVDPEVVIFRADEGAAPGVPDVLDLAAGNDVPLDLAVVLGIDLDRTVILVGRDLARGLDSDTDIRTDVRMLRRIDVCQHDIVFCRDIPAGIQDVAEQGMDADRLEGGRAAQGHDRTGIDITHAQHQHVARASVELELEGIGEHQVGTVVHDPEIVQHRIIERVVEQIHHVLDGHARLDLDRDLSPVRAVHFIHDQGDRLRGSGRGVGKRRGVGDISEDFAGHVVAGAVSEPVEVE